MRYQLLSALFALAAVVLCFATLPAPRWDNMRVRHAWDAVPENWEGLGIPSADTTINLHLALKPRREKALVTALYEEQVAELVMPHPHTLELVKSWLKYHGVPSSASLTHGGNWLTLTGVSVSKANDLLGASYQLYRHTETKEIIIRTVGYSLPPALHGHVQTVAPTTFFASPRMSWQTPRKRSGRAAAEQVKATSGDFVTTLLGRADSEDDVTPPFLRWLYNSITYVPAATDRNVFGIAGYVKEYPNPVDLTTFMNRFHSPETRATYTVVEVDNGEYDPTNPGLEANMNVQYASGIAYPTPITYYSVGGDGTEGEDEQYLSWLNYMLGLDQIPQTISTSYANYETELSLDYARAVCDLFMQLAARGISVLFSSGNDGVGEGDCMTDGNVRFKPTFPASCPWVTAVGGTTRYEPEIAADLSGGGFSDYFKRPDYQDEAVTTFFENSGDQYHGLYNASGRGFPDIAAQAFDIGIIFRNEYEVVEGTSCAAPIVAGIISLLNDYQISQGRHPLGFLNPWLYGIARAGLTDITSGSNPGCNTDGFSAIEGWDPVTGLGSLNFKRLQHILVANLLP
ncbi:subtilisin-like protein [Lactarius akahatsu]|uniref:tripeptidyl-peptidase II n=1 Tax=Lactarius akahatsu TaxID=416441 RepID=A0AAD4LGL2_9AGAM|nr:subtilisin-like protein [Lactarius akahatsu]